MPAKSIILPPNLVENRKFEGKSAYYRDYCNRHRHGRKATTLTRSYTSLPVRTTKNAYNVAGDVGNIQLSDHYTTYPAALAMGYTRDDFEKCLGNTKELQLLTGSQNNCQGKKQFDLEDTEEGFAEKIPDSLRKIEQAWLDEFDTTKRERGNVYGLAGKKVNLLSRKDNEATTHKKSKSLPGLDKWLATANEYEKQVVHSFVSQMGDAYHAKPGTLRPKSTPVGLQLTGNRVDRPKAGRSVRINSKLVSPRLEDISAKTLLPSPPKTPPKGDSFRASPPRSRCSTSSSVRSSVDGSVEQHEVATQAPYPIEGKPSSPVYEQTRPSTVPTNLHHSCENCRNCEACKKKMLMKMVDELAAGTHTSYEDLLKDKAHNLKTVASQMYRSANMVDPLEDYLHPGCSFQNVSPRKKGDFTIHPDFISENIVDLKKLRRKHAKYFGESNAR